MVIHKEKPKRHICWLAAGCISHGVLIVLALLPALYWQFIASQPPVISAATSVQIASDDKVHIPVASIRDGNLHRFAWIADDGKVVRFIVINRFPQQLKLGVAFDACLLCGDQGYIQEGNQIICGACGVHIFIPSIGKAGGCNPVPLEHWSLVGSGGTTAGITYQPTRAGKWHNVF